MRPIFETPTLIILDPMLALQALYTPKFLQDAHASYAPRDNLSQVKLLALFNHPQSPHKGCLTVSLKGDLLVIAVSRAKEDPPAARSI